MTIGMSGRPGCCCATNRCPRSTRITSTRITGSWRSASSGRSLATGVAVLAVFHDTGAIRRLATRVARLDGGRVVAEGTADEILGELEAV